MKFTDNLFSPSPAILPISRDYHHGESEAEHSHSRAQLIHAISGVLTVTTPLGSWVVPPGRAVWLPSGIVHSLRFIGTVQVRTLMVDPLARADLPAQCQVVQISSLLRELILCAMSIAPDYPRGGREERIMELILDELRTLPILPVHLPEPQESHLLALCRHIQQSLGESWDVGQAAAYLGVSGRTLSRRFQRETGLRFGDWVRRAKLLGALNALATGRSVLDVALDLGYDSPSAFSAMFRRSLGVSPTQYFGQALPVATAPKE